MWDNHFNLAVINWFGQFTTMSAQANQVIQYVEAAYLFKGLPVMAVIWFYWFGAGDARTNTRRTIIAALIGCVLAVFIARLINHMAPFQARPFANAALPYLDYIGLVPRETQSLFDWNSFPSDHAALFFSLAMGVFMLSRRVGSLLFLYVLLVIALPRIYLGLHYATDIVAGAAIGTASVWLSTRKSIIDLYGERCMALLKKHPAAFQTVFFICCVEISVMFTDVRLFMGTFKSLL
jgi:membrane-associated phospholipid phosphatase